MRKWPVVALGDVFTIARGGSPRPIDDFITDDPRGTNWIMIGDAVEGSKYITQTKKRIRKEGVSRSREVKAGDFLLTNSMSFGHPYILATSGCIHDGWLVLSPRDTDTVDQDYLYHLLGSPFVYSEFERLAAGAVVKNLNIDLVRGVRVPLPPLPEQRRIADVLDNCDAIRRKRKEASGLTEDLLRSSFVTTFGDPVVNPRGWPMRLLGEVSSRIDYGVTASANPRAVGPQFLRITDIQDNRVDWELVPYCECDTVAAERARLADGDIVFARTGATTGKSYWIRECPKDAVFASYLIRIRPGEQVLSSYLSEFFHSAGYWSQVRAMAEGVAQPGVNASKLAAMRIPIPPLSEQQKFKETVTTVGRLQKSCERARRESDLLFMSVVARAFSRTPDRAEAAC